MKIDIDKATKRELVKLLKTQCTSERLASFLYQLEPSLTNTQKLTIGGGSDNADAYDSYRERQTKADWEDSK